QIKALCHVTNLMQSGIRTQGNSRSHQDQKRSKLLRRLLQFSKYALRLGGGQLLFTIDNLFDLRQKPAIDPGQLENFVDGETGAQGVSYEKHPLGVGCAQLGRDHITGKDVAVGVKFDPNAPW